MDRYLVGLGLFALAAAVFVTGFVAPAHAQSAGYTQCVVVKTDFADEVTRINDTKVLEIPSGWTPVGGGAVPKGMQYVGVIVLCK